MKSYPLLIDIRLEVRQRRGDTSLIILVPESRSDETKVRVNYYWSRHRNPFNKFKRYGVKVVDVSFLITVIDGVTQFII